MKFSIFMMPLHHPTENPSLAFDRDIALIQLADELGYDEFFIGEHHSGGWETMAAIAVGDRRQSILPKRSTSWAERRFVTGVGLSVSFVSSRM